MIFTEWVEKHGISDARKTFGLSDHMVFKVRHGENVVGVCGRWIGSEPLGNGESVESAKQRLRSAVQYCFETEETIERS